MNDIRLFWWVALGLQNSIRPAWSGTNIKWQYKKIERYKFYHPSYSGKSNYSWGIEEYTTRMIETLKAFTTSERKTATKKPPVSERNSSFLKINTYYHLKVC